MSESPNRPGAITWTDLAVADADNIRDFYSAVVGWTSEPLDMGGYANHCMKDADGNVVAGICHARGINAGVPAAWLIYISVPDLDASMREALARHGKVLAGPAECGKIRFCVIQDPAGAAAVIFQPIT